MVGFPRGQLGGANQSGVRLGYGPFAVGHDQFFAVARQTNRGRIPARGNEAAARCAALAPRSTRRGHCCRRWLHRASCHRRQGQGVRVLPGGLHGQPHVNKLDRCAFVGINDADRVAIAIGHEKSAVGVQNQIVGVLLRRDGLTDLGRCQVNDRDRGRAQLLTKAVFSSAAQHHVVRVLADWHLK